VRILEEQGNGVLRIYGGRFAIDSRTDEVERKYRKSPRTMEMGVMPYDALLRSYSEASAGIVWFSPNLERHFSFNFRAADYLSCGVPLIVNDYMPISELVKRYDAGWVIKGSSDFEDMARKVMSDNESLTHKSDNAMILSAQEFAPSRYMETLLNMLKSPSKKTTRENLIGGLIRIVDRYVKEGIENSDMLREIKKLEAENIRLSKRLVTRDSEILRLNNEKTEMLRKSGWLSDEVKRLSDEVSRLRDEILRLKNEKDRLDKESAEANAKITELYRENGFLKDENVRLMGEKNSQDDDIIRLKNEIIEMKKAIPNLKSEIQKRDTMIGELRKKEAELEGIKSLPMYRLYKKVF
jgi:FtsZ-binding cell division protein ZapB